MIKKWHETLRTLEKGRPFIYSDDAILCSLLIRGVFHLSLRALQGFMFSLVSLLGLSIRIPSYTQISRRARSLNKALLRLSKKRPCDIVFDSTGLRVFGEGEWKVRQHGRSKRRTWRKLHIAVDPDSGEIILAEATSNGKGCGDAETAKPMLKKLPKSVCRVFGDGSYDGLEFREGLEELGTDPVIPPPKGAILHRNGNGAMQKRNDAIAEIVGFGGEENGRKLWKILKGYHKSSLVETSMYRIKQLTGETLRSRTASGQQTESIVKCLIVNKRTRLGMPKGQWI
ncbi:MAG: IS5 family transposase [Chlamydiae bacterium]|nr:IS5 family transposase [Chlamydiota bacterium]